MKSPLFSIALTFLLGMAFLGTGCGDSGEKTVMTPDGEVTVTRDKEGTVSYTGPDGETATIAGGENMAPPADWPKEVPIYPGAKIVASVSLGENSNVTANSGKPVDEVKEFYQGKLSAAGWVQTTMMDMGRGAVIGYEKEGRTLSIVLGANGSETSINLSITAGE